MDGPTQRISPRLAKLPRRRNRLFLASLLGSFLHKNSFRDLEVFCAFIGYPRSGHTLIGSLLDAHPNAVIGDELDALRFLEAGFSKGQICYLLLRNARKAAAAGRQRTGYGYRVPGQWQGRFDKLRVIGDKMGGTTALRLQSHPWLLDSLPGMLQLKTKYVHVLRNPYDVIATIHTRQRTPLEQAVENFFKRCQAVAYIRERLPQDVFDLRHEMFIDDPRAVLKRLCAFLGLSDDDAYYDACASIVFRSPHHSRREIIWSDDLLATVARRLHDFRFLDGYSYDT
ncbi:MAG TPA: sulfotransferase [Candidatus Binatia bacterium]|nr:sulfotransferase [Candidatus Binatia bacterium]